MEIQEVIRKISQGDDPNTIFESPTLPSFSSELTPFLFHPDHYDSAHQLLVAMISKHACPSLFNNIASSILAYIKSLKPSDTFIVSDSILELIISQLHSKDIYISTQSSEALETLHIIRPSIGDSLVQYLQEIPSDSTIMIRFYTLLIKILSVNPSARAHTNGRDTDEIMETDYGVFKPFMNGLKDDKDPLMQLSLLEILEQSSEEWIRQLDLVDLDTILLSMVENTHPFCSGSALRILVRRDIPPEKFVQILVTFGRQMSGDVENIAFVDGLMNFCFEDKHLERVLKESELLNEWLSFRKGNSKLKAVTMNSVAKVMRKNALSHDLRLDLFKAIGPVNDVGRSDTGVEIVMEYAKSQVVELRFGAYELLTAVACVKKGAHMLMAYGGFFEFCCNRNLEVVKEGKELKFSLVQALYASDVTSLLSAEVVRVLEKVIEDGPFYMRAQRDISLE